MRAATGTAQVPDRHTPVECNNLSLEIAGLQLIEAADLSVERGEVVALMGPSGTGKTSLLHCLAGLRPATAGQVKIDGCDLSTLTEKQRSRLRLTQIGLILQFGELLPELTVAENVALPLLLRRRPDPAQVTKTLTAVGLGDRGNSWPKELSGGETQRVGFARAIVASPTVILADEPTGSVDEHRSQILMDLLMELSRSTGAATILATHDPAIGARADRIVTLDHRLLRSVA